MVGVERNALCAVSDDDSLGGDPRMRRWFGRIGGVLRGCTPLAYSLFGAVENFGTLVCAALSRLVGNFACCRYSLGWAPFRDGIIGWNIFITKYEED